VAGLAAVIFASLGSIDFQTGATYSLMSSSWMALVVILLAASHSDGTRWKQMEIGWFMALGGAIGATIGGLIRAKERGLILRRRQK
jgi:hypothetical protein